MCLKDLRQLREVLIKVRSASITQFNRPQVTLPEILLADFNFHNPLTETSAKDNRHRQPLQSGWTFNPVALLPGLLFKLNVIKQDKAIGLIDQVEVSQPGEKCRLRNCDFHGVPFVRTKRALTLRNCSDLHRAAALSFPSATSN